ncbi:GUN4 domain-containing protein [Nostoc sphaeroides]|uniref:GUN4 domain-containing protein (Plasmid) n=1 Tax=Nostoc sphaeroides CCNUC1 TaxID=2653204 RepID=A0A5P8VWI1_9NOSO|nr:GUN4 domain-containing protein [Nostoc sphaeroides]QFS44768.1 GUN4 domain-containing protein [Nostoc sphaeroides CCNUC1]
MTGQSTQQQKILILTAIPHGLRLDREIREIEEAIRRSVRRDFFEIRVRTAVRSQDIRRAIAQERPQIVHFCGHGTADGSLVLEDDGGNNKNVLPEGLAALFKLHANYVNCVLLNACHSAKPALAISQHINYVIGMNQEINEKAAIAFAQGFYDALGYEALDNQDVFQRAFDEGLVAIQLEDTLEGQIPVLQNKAITETNLQVSFPGVEFKQELNNNFAEILESISANPNLGSKADYTKLENFLKAQQWKEADCETYRIILQLVGREEQGWIRKEELLNFPCTHLKWIDYLWLKYSNSKFGFSVQQRIWRTIGGQTGKFDGVIHRKLADYLGWRRNDDWLRYDDFTLSLEAKEGHLPSFGYSLQRWDEWEPSFRSFFLRVSACVQEAKVVD